MFQNTLFLTPGIYNENDALVQMLYNKRMLNQEYIVAGITLIMITDEILDEHINATLQSPTNQPYITIYYTGFKFHTRTWDKSRSR